jgi:hypothetical protein
MKKLLCVLLTIGVIALMSCEKESNLTPLTTKWTVGDTGKMDTTLTLKSQTTGDLLFKINNYSLCPTHIVGLTIKVNGVSVLQTDISKVVTLEQKVPVKLNDNITVQTKLIETGALVLCIALGKAECEITE